MRIFLLLLVSIYWTFTALEQYPFEKKPAILYEKFTKWKLDTTIKNKVTYSIIIPHFFTNKESLHVQITGKVGNDTSTIKVYRSRKLLQSFSEPFDLQSFNDTDL